MRQGVQEQERGAWWAFIYRVGMANVVCEECGEAAPEHKIRLMDGKMVCLDCFKEYKRGW